MTKKAKFLMPKKTPDSNCLKIKLPSASEIPKKTTQFNESHSSGFYGKKNYTLSYQTHT